MTEAQRHRGPDGGGLFSDPQAGLALGHRRLAILDLSEAGRQPMTSRDGRWTLVLNGEIFNYLELRRELGGEFRTATDTEVLLEACAAWGVEEALARSVGMFAFALWDARERELILARDRAGEKPLVYFWDGRTLAFASELKALGPLHGRRLDPEALDCYLALGYVPAPLAIFRNCRKLPPGHLLRFKSGVHRVGRWWFPERVRQTRSRTNDGHELLLFGGGFFLELSDDRVQPIWQLPGGCQPGAGIKPVDSEEQPLLLGYVELLAAFEHPVGECDEIGVLLRICSDERKTADVVQQARGVSRQGVLAAKRG
jgi:hypothetical protein